MIRDSVKPMAEISDKKATASYMLTHCHLTYWPRFDAAWKALCITCINVCLAITTSRELSHSLPTSRSTVYLHLLKMTNQFYSREIANRNRRQLINACLDLYGREEIKSKGPRRIKELLQAESKVSHFYHLKQKVTLAQNASKKLPSDKTLPVTMSSNFCSEF